MRRKKMFNFLLEVNTSASLFLLYILLRTVSMLITVVSIDRPYLLYLLLRGRYSVMLEAC
jgi:hypothetical protein